MFYLFIFRVERWQLERGGRAAVDPYSALHYPFTIAELQQISASISSSMTVTVNIKHLNQNENIS